MELDIGGDGNLENSNFDLSWYLEDPDVLAILLQSKHGLLMLIRQAKLPCIYVDS